jgi:hypothetical protein
MHAFISRAIDPHFEKVDALCEKINSFADLSPGWDGEDGVAPTAPVLGAACRLLRELPREADLPSVAPAPDGEIGLTWINGAKQLNAIVHADTHLVWVKRVEAGGCFVPGAEIDLSAGGYPSAFAREVAALYA